MKSLCIALALSFLSLIAYASGKDVVGQWITQDGDSRVEIFQNSDGKFYGKIVWLKYPKNSDGTEKLDTKNPKESMKIQKIEGLQILKSFEYSADDEEWSGGTIYDPKSGSTYKCVIWFDDDDNTLNVKGYIGFSLMGKTVQWKRSIN